MTVRRLNPFGRFVIAFAIVGLALFAVCLILPTRFGFGT